jgi:hypothetical protein
MFISFNSFGIYLFRVPSIFVNMGRKGGGPKETNTNVLIFSVYFYFNGLKLQNRSISEFFFLKCRLDWTQTIYEYCEIIINRGIVILAHVMVHLNHKKIKSNEVQFSHWLLPVVFETTNSRTYGSMHFIETREIVANDENSSQNSLYYYLCSQYSVKYVVTNIL